MERCGPPGGPPVPPSGAGLPAQPDSGDPESHRSPGQSRGSPPRPCETPALPVPTAAAAAWLWVQPDLPTSSYMCCCEHWDSGRSGFMGSCAVSSDVQFIILIYVSKHKVQLRPFKPCIYTGLSSSEVRPAGKAPNISVNWSCGDGGLEEISTSTGRRKDSGTPSRLCRRAMFARWHRLQQQVGQRCPEEVTFSAPT